MKYQGELLLLIVLILALLTRPVFLQRMLNTFVGRVFMLVGILALASKNKNYGFLGALIMISLLQSFQEGFTISTDDEKKSDDKEHDEEKEGEGDKHDKKHKDGEHKDGEHKDGEDKNGEEHKEGENKEGEYKEGEDKEGEHKEGFSLLPRMDMRFSEMDPLEAENAVRPKPSAMYPAPDPKTRGQNKNFVDNVLGTVKHLFSRA